MTLRRLLGHLLVDMGLAICAVGVVVYGEWKSVAVEGARKVREREEAGRWN